MNEREMNKDELRNAPFLDSLKKEEVFQVPESYFEDLNGKLKDRIEDDEIQQITDGWGEKEKKTLFETPEGYLEQLPDKIRKRVLDLPSNLNPSASSRGRRWLRHGTWASIAAAVVLLFLLGYWLNEPKSGKSDIPLVEISAEQQLQQSLEQASGDELLAAIDVEDYSLDMIIEAMDEDDLAALPGTYELELTEDEISDLLDDVEISDFEEDLFELSGDE